MTNKKERNQGISRRRFLKTSAAGLGGTLLCRNESLLGAGRASPDDFSHIYHSRNGTPGQNVAKVFDTAYGGIENFIGHDDIVLLRPNLQWPRNGYTNTDTGLAMIDLILRRPGGFGGEIHVIEDNHSQNPHTYPKSGWCTTDKRSNGPYNWFEVIRYFIDNAGKYPDGIHKDRETGQINVTFQFLLGWGSFTFEDPHPILPSYSGKYYGGAWERLDGSADPFRLFKSKYPRRTSFNVRRSDIRYTSDIARVSPLKTEYDMQYYIIKSQHSGLYVSLYKEHLTAWDPVRERFTSQPVKLINMCTLNHHSHEAGVTSIVKGHFGMVAEAFHYTGWPDAKPPTFYYAGGAIGYNMAMIRQADLHMSCAERIGRVSRTEDDAYRARSVAISTDPVALDYYAGKYILFPAGGIFGKGGWGAKKTMSNDPSLPGGYYGLTLEFCRDPLADHSIINGTLDEEEMVVHLFDYGPDIDSDGDVDMEDYQRFQTCYSGSDVPPSGPGCDAADFDHDRDVDLADYRTFANYFNGPE